MSGKVHEFRWLLTLTSQVSEIFVEIEGFISNTTKEESAHSPLLPQKG
jgi:hypothetical protein